eukprot:3564369-Rhodomonas_salina.1
MAGTDRLYATTRARSTLPPSARTDLARSTACCWLVAMPGTCYAVSGTDVAHGVPRSRTRPRAPRSQSPRGGLY